MKASSALETRSLIGAGDSCLSASHLCALSPRTEFFFGVERGVLLLTRGLLILSLWRKMKCGWAGAYELVVAIAL